MCGLKFYRIFIKAFVIEYLTACLDCNISILESLLHNNYVTIFACQHNV